MNRTAVGRPRWHLPPTEDIEILRRTGARNVNLQPKKFFSHTNHSSARHLERGHFFRKQKSFAERTTKRTYKTTINYHGTLFHDSLLLYCTRSNILLTNHGIVEAKLPPKKFVSHTASACVITRTRGHLFQKQNHSRNEQRGESRNVQDKN